MAQPSASNGTPIDPVGRQRAFDALFRANYGGLCRFVARLVGSRAVGEEIVQEVFLYVWERHAQIDETTPTRPYLYRAARNAALNALRRQRIEKRSAMGIAAAEPRPTEIPDPMEYEDLVHAVQQAVERLPERTRLVYTMSRQEGLTYKEIAATLDLSVKTVEAQMARAFRLLRKALSPFLTGVILFGLGTGCSGPLP